MPVRKAIDRQKWRGRVRWGPLKSHDRTTGRQDVRTTRRQHRLGLGQCLGAGKKKARQGLGDLGWKCQFPLDYWYSSSRPLDRTSTLPYLRGLDSGSKGPTSLPGSRGRRSGSGLGHGCIHCIVAAKGFPPALVSQNSKLANRTRHTHLPSAIRSPAYAPHAP